MKNDRAREDLYEWMAKQELIKVVSDILLNKYWKTQYFLPPVSDNRLREPEK